MEAQRPNPDALLAEINAAAARDRRGRLKIFFGASAGVGKTYAMLIAAREQMRAGTDVVIGLLETHGRADGEVTPRHRPSQAGTANLIPTPRTVCR